MHGHFQFWIDRSGTFHGFTAWFNVDFKSMEPGGTAVQLDTGPHSEYVNQMDPYILYSTAPV